MLRRTAIALLLIPLFALMVQSLPWVIGLVGLCHAWAQLELASLIPGLSRTTRIVHSTGSTLLLGWFAVQLASGHSQNLLLALLITVCCYLAFSVAQASRGEDPDTAWLLVRAVALITLPLAFLPALATHDGFPYLLLTVGASWGADTAAIVAGKLCGRTPLAPVLSPKKTVEGAVAGVFASGLIWAIALFFYWPPDGLLGGLFTPDGQLPQGHLLAAASAVTMFALGCVMGMLGILGDLAFSLFKRQAHVKDYSSALPGHGGVLDRADSMLLVIPVVYLLVYGF